VLVTSAAARAPFAGRDTLSDERLVPRATQTVGSDINRSALPACSERGSTSAGTEFSEVPHVFHAEHRMVVDEVTYG
jgi:hypothetical protein